MKISPPSIQRSHWKQSPLYALAGEMAVVAPGATIILLPQTAASAPKAYECAADRAGGSEFHFPEIPTLTILKRFSGPRHNALSELSAGCMSKMTTENTIEH